MAVPYGARFPQYLSALMQFIWFEEDEACLIVCMLGLFVFFNNIVSFALAMVIPYLFIRIKKKNAKGFLKHLTYYCGLARFDGYPTFFERHFTE